MNNPLAFPFARPAVAAAFLAVLVSSWTCPRHASAQFGSSVSVTSPSSGSSVGGTIAVTAQASSVFGIAGVQFQLDGVNLGAEDTASPYSISWNTTTVPGGSHTLRAVARDNFGNRRTSDPVTVTVDNTRPTVRIDQAVGQPDPANTSPINFTAVFSEPVSAFTAASVTVGGTAGGTKTVTVTGGPSTYNVAVSGMSDGMVTVTVAAGGARDGAGNVNTASTSTDNAVSFNAAPSVALTSPADGATVSGAVTLAASASDNDGIAGVQFYVDGAPIGGEDKTAPYQQVWDATNAAEGAHSLTAVARDKVGNAAASAPVTVTVGSATAVSRIEENSAAVTYTGTWAQGNRDRSWSGGTAAVSTSAGARASVRFNGTSVKWIGFRGPQAGIAHVYLDGTRVATVDLYAATETVQAIVFQATGLASATHTLAIDVTGAKHALSSDYYVVVDAFDVAGTAAPVDPPPAATGDVFVSLEPGPVQWWRPDGTFRATLVSTVTGTGEGMGFDSNKNLYVTRWCMDPGCSSGNGIERFDSAGVSRGRWGGEFECGPHAIVFDALDTAYVGNAGCNGTLWKLAPGQPRVEYPVAVENQGSFWIDLAPDGCTLFYTSWGPNVKRYNVCTRAQLPNFNAAPLPGGETHDLRVLPDGGVLVSSGEVIARLDVRGVLVQTYSAPEPSYWTGLDLPGDGTFWVGNYLTSNVYRFDLATGRILTGFNTGTPAHTVVGIRVKK